MLLLSGSSNPNLAAEIAQALDITQLAVNINKFPNDEKRVWITDDVIGQNIVLVQSFTQPVDEHIMEFILLADALERAGARHVHAVIPWLGYSLQDKIFRPGESLSAKVIADLVSNAYVKRLLLLDLHNNSIPGFFSIPTRLISSVELFATYVENKFAHTNMVVASPDFGGLKRARDFAVRLDTDLVNIDKQRNLKTGEVTASEVHGDVKGRTVMLFDDCIVGGGTVIETAKLLKEEGAVAVHFLATHGLFVGDAQDKIAASDVDSIVITNSIQHASLTGKITSLSAAPLFAESLQAWA